ncbi:hypothetical protein PMI01_02989 [Caulobacter sp. AP07]|uniref:YybH family protein n=1 Tax=Caulobacter sp. AP07 TaxID=1144304 RepID=UPI000271E8C3|nr:DUF4440 domain-containing protein [Caulobacter sp. AP07]EJL30766.1 hypothetical protein PMI01_02989 [Caulobacter sp. AP07]
MDATETTKAAIAARSRLFEQAYGAGDAEKLVSDYFVEDGLEPIACPPGGTPPIGGRGNLVAMFTGMFADAPKIRLETETLRVSPVQAFEVGRAFLTLADGSGAIGRYTVCWVKSGEDWRAAVDFFAQDGWANL